ncbi:MAG: phospholipase D-like domain-containing protein [Myxococcota bacterium]
MSASESTAFQEALSWFGPLAWRPSERRRAERYLRQIGRANRALAARGERPNEEAYHAWLLHRTRQSLVKAFNVWRSSLNEQVNGGRRRVQAVPLEEPADARRTDLAWSDGLMKDGRIVPRFDLNLISAGMLERLPGIGSVSAARIVESRRFDGPFHAVSELEDRRLLRGDAYDLARVWLYVAMHGAPRWHLSSPAIDQFLNSPSPLTLTGLIAATEGEFERLESSGVPTSRRPLTARLLSALKHAQDIVEQDGNPSALARVDADTIEAWYERYLRTEAIRAAQAAEADIAGAGMIKDSRYLPVALRLMGAASQTLRVVMFFLNYRKDDLRHPVRPLLEAVVSAHERGVDVRVILDRDADGEPYGSRIINREAFDTLTQKGVRVRFDAEHTLTHTKVLAVDDRHTLIGSHNWTAGSIHAYDDMSVYIDSSALRTQMEERFDALWEKAAQAGGLA